MEAFLFLGIFGNFTQLPKKTGQNGASAIPLLYRMISKILEKTAMAEET